MRAVSLLVAFCLLAGPAYSQTKTELRAQKFMVETREKVVQQGRAVEVGITLSDVENQPRPARTEIPAEVTIHTPDGGVRMVPILFKPGETVKRVPIMIDQTGIADIKVRNPEFLDGGTAVKVKRLKPQGWFAPPRIGAWGWLAGPPEEWWHLGRAVASLVTHRRVGRYTVELRKNPDREMLADGKDAVEIEIWVDEDDEQEDDIRVWMHHSGGSLAPKPLLIPKRTEVGIARLVSVDPADVRVVLMNAQPPVLAKGGVRDLSVRFVPAISKIDVTVTPETPTLFEDATVDITLLDASNTTIATHRDRQVSLWLKEGRGELTPRDVVIKAQAFAERVRVQPTTPGRLVVGARSPNLRNVESNSVRVVFPLLAVVLTLAGGGGGGVLSFLNEKVWKKSKRQVVSLIVRVLIGAVAGLVLYYVALQGVGHALSTRYLATSIGQLVVGFVGGWMGPSVFDLARSFFKRS